MARIKLAGRPRAVPGEVQDKLVGVRLSGRTVTAIRQRAVKRGLTVPGWIRGVVRKAVGMRA